MVGYGLLIWIFQLCLIITNHCFLQSIICERPTDSKTETRIEIEITYRHRYHDDHLQPSQGKYAYRFTHHINNIPKSINQDMRIGNNRQANSNNQNLRHGFRFSNIDKGAGAFTMSTYDNDISDSGMRLRNNLVTSGQLIHVMSLSAASRPMENATNTLTVAHNACNDIINTVSVSWIALIQGGSCTADNKLRNVMKMSTPPATVLIYGNSKMNKQDSYLSYSSEETPMVIYLPWNNINALVERCFNSSGQVVIPQEVKSKVNKSLLDWQINRQNSCNISIKVYTISDENFLSKTSVLFVSISFILLMVISLAWLMFYYVQRFRYIHTKEQFSRRLAHMAKKAVAKIPVKTLKQGDRETDPDLDNCAICIECYKPSDTVRILPCKHYFHKSCIDPWLLEQRSCPMCKLNILHAYGFLPNERGSIISEDRLSELDSSLELQFMSGNIVPTVPTTSTRVQAYCQARDSNYINVSTLPPIFTEPSCHSSNRWSSLLLKRPQRVSHRIDRSVSLRHLSGSVEERITFLSHNRLLSHSATDTTSAIIQDNNNNNNIINNNNINNNIINNNNINNNSPPHIPMFQWQLTSTSSATTAAMDPGSQSTISSSH